jgi:predicted alpha/beta superfamily hydrolase
MRVFLLSTTGFLVGLAVTALTTQTKASEVQSAKPSPAASAAAPAAIKVIRLPSTEEFDLASKATGTTYRIRVAKPSTPQPKDGFPVVYVLDAWAAFGTAAESALCLSVFGEIKPPLIVSVTYPTDDLAAIWSLRARDLTLPAAPEKMVMDPEWKALFTSGLGGSDPFYRFISEELRPLIGGRYSVDVADQTLFGDSFGGLFALDTMFKHPGTFRTYVAASPSIWWADRQLLGGEGAFVESVSAGRANPRVLITVGRLEGEGMVKDAQGLAERLAKIHGREGYQAEFHLFEGETHMSAPPASISRALRFALKP